MILAEAGFESTLPFCVSFTITDRTFINASDVFPRFQKGTCIAFRVCNLHILSKRQLCLVAVVEK